ncbi:DUF7017 domain-containing protein [Thiofilum flexile]|uniref:DUF7017 domain-containing protein n=1 Tax=Thiofilum flexile TaxID=125627 RepID=UPI000362AA09|nr:hypothetical protein [Thiofilum flexile]
MIDSKSVFSKRKEGNLDEAYAIAVKLMSNPDKNEWDIKAFAWCIIDLIKRAAKLGNQQDLTYYGEQIKNLEISFSDNILLNQKEYVLKLCNANRQNILKAKELSKQGDHQAAFKIISQIYNDGDKSDEVQTNLAWAIYRVAKEMMDQEPPNFTSAKRYINSYFSLKVDKPSLLHSCFLQLADKIAKDGKLNMGAFVKIWGLEYLRPEDYEQYRTNEGSLYLSLAEKVVQHASKDAFLRGDKEDLLYILPFVNNCIDRYPDSLWLKLSKARILMTLDRGDDALSYGLDIVKNKVNEYWAWELLGDIHQPSSSKIALACYCKALLCSKDISFIGKVKIKLAELLIQAASYSEAKLEIEELVNHRVKNNEKIPETVKRIQNYPWYESIVSAVSNQDFYKSTAIHAEELLHRKLPWIDGVLGKPFTIDDKKKSAKRSIYIQSNPCPIEVVVPDHKISVKKKQVGAGVRIKGEYDNENRFQIYTIEDRSTKEKWDIFNELIGVVYYINREKGLLHFRISKTIDGLMPIGSLSDKYEEGDAIAVRISKHTNKKDIRYKAITSCRTTKPIPESLIKSFKSNVREDNGMGFTDDGVFIPPQMIKAYDIRDDDYISGKAILNYNKKRSEWGWKAISINSVVINNSADVG